MDYKARLNEIDAQIEALKKEQVGLAEAWVVNSHPLKPGDIVEINTGSSYRGMKMEVTRVWVAKEGWRHRRWYWLAAGLVLKKDGTPGQLGGRWCLDVDGEAVSGDAA